MPIGTFNEQNFYQRFWKNATRQRITVFWYLSDRSDIGVAVHLSEIERDESIVLLVAHSESNHTLKTDTTDRYRR